MFTKKVALIIVVLFFNFLSFSQDGDKVIRDSLIKVMNFAKADSLKVKAVLTLLKMSYRSEPDSAIRLTNRWLSVAQKLKMNTQVSFMFWIKAQSFKSNGTMDSAIALHLKGLKIREATGDKKGIVDSYNGLGQSYDLIMNYDKALEFYNIGLDASRKMKDKNGEAAILSNLSATYRAMKQNEKSLEVMLQSMEIKKSLGNEASYYSGLGNLANAFGALKRFASADSCLRLNLDYAIKKNDKKIIALCYNNLGASLNKQKKFKEAAEIMENVVQLMKEINQPELKRRSFYGLHEAYIGLGRYKEGYENYKRYKGVEDSLIKGDNIKQAKEMELKYEGEKKAKEIELLNKDKAIQDTELDKRKNMIIFFAVMLVLFGALTIIVVRNNIQRKKSNRLLLKLNHEIMEQKNEVELQKNIVHEKVTEITDSIKYAKRLQQAILPPLNYLTDKLPNSFVLYKPKDIVAGDFYWADEKDGIFFVAAADCTGHGVPGAMVSVVCSNALNRTVNEFGITDPGKILDKTTELVLETFARSGEDIKDGMDISLVAIQSPSPKERDGRVRLTWAGANNPLVYFKDGSIFEISASKQPIGKHDNFKPFTTHQLELSAGDSIYLFTDGFADQFGGPKGKKFKYRQFTEILINQQKNEIGLIQNHLSKAFDDWKGTFEQVDDVTIIGIRL